MRNSKSEKLDRKLLILLLFNKRKNEYRPHKILLKSYTPIKHSLKDKNRIKHI